MQIPYNEELRPDTGLYNAKLGIWLFLASEVMLFGALFSAYIMLRTSDPFWFDIKPKLNDLRFSFLIKNLYRKINLFITKSNRR